MKNLATKIDFDYFCFQKWTSFAAVTRYRGIDLQKNVYTINSMNFVFFELVRGILVVETTFAEIKPIFAPFIKHAD